jgi:hypothetical protein
MRKLLFGIIVFVMGALASAVFVSCATTSGGSAANQCATLFKRGWESYTKSGNDDIEKYQKAIEEWKRVVEIDPVFVPDNSSSLTFLVKYSGKFPVLFYLGSVYHDLGKKQSGEEAKQSYLKAIECFDEILNRNLPQRDATLNYKAQCYVRLGDTENAVKTIRELVNTTGNEEIIAKGKAEIARLDPALGRQEWEARIAAEYACVCYVSASGRDGNDGRTEATAFKTLERAVSYLTTSALGDKYAVVVIGTLNQRSEGGDDEEDAFVIISLYGDSFLITGIPNAPSGTKAVISAAGTDKRAVFVSSNRSGGAFRFEHIEISGSKNRGLVVSLETEATLGDGAVVRNNTGGGVAVVEPKDEVKDSYAPGHLIIEGGIIENNKISGQEAGTGTGAGVYVGGKLTMKWGAVRNNTAIGEYSSGGGILFNGNYKSVISGGEISGNVAQFGGGISVFGEATVTMSGGTVSGNTGVGSGVAVSEGSVFNQNGGTVSGNKAPAGYQNIQVYR